MSKERKIVIWSHPDALVQTTYVDQFGDERPSYYNYDLRSFFISYNGLEKYNIHLGSNFATIEDKKYEIPPKDDHSYFGLSWQENIKNLDPNDLNILWINIIDGDVIKDDKGNWKVKPELLSFCKKNNFQIFYSTTREWNSMGGKEEFLTSFLEWADVHKNIIFLQNNLLKETTKSLIENHHWSWKFKPTHLLTKGFKIENYFKSLPDFFRYYYLYRYKTAPNFIPRKKIKPSIRKYKCSFYGGTMRAWRVAFLLNAHKDNLVNKRDFFHTVISQRETDDNGEHYFSPWNKYPEFIKPINKHYKTNYAARKLVDTLKVEENLDSQSEINTRLFKEGQEWMIGDALQDSYFNVVIEPQNTLDATHITEKTWKPFMGGTPSIWLAGPHVCEHLLSLGFKLYPWIDYSFDNVTTPTQGGLSYDTGGVMDRYYKFYNEFKRLMNMSRSEHENLLHKHRDILIHNQENFYNLEEKNKAIFNETIRSFQTLSQI